MFHIKHSSVAKYIYISGYSYFKYFIFDPNIHIRHFKRWRHSTLVFLYLVKYGALSLDDGIIKTLSLDDGVRASINK